MYTYDLIKQIATEKVAAMNKESGLPGLVSEISPLATAGIGALTGMGIGALKERLLNPPEERNYLGSTALGGLGGFLGAMSSRGWGTQGGKTLAAAGLNALPESMLLSLLAPDQTDMKFQTKRELDELTPMLNNPDIDEETRGYIRQYMANEQKRYGL